MRGIQDTSQLMAAAEVAELITAGRCLVISGEDALLDALPQGNWIGGSIPYFYLKDEIGRMDKEHMHVTDFTDLVEEFTIATYQEDSLQNVCVDGYDNGFNFL
ncbi:MAG: hypothetical protein AAFQ98_19210, partial [Bacteroidota bacterium]